MAKLVTKKEYKRRRARFEVAAGLSDFLITLGCLALAFVCALLIRELIVWLKSDAESSFGLFGRVLDQTLRTNPTQAPKILR